MRRGVSLCALLAALVFHGSEAAAQARGQGWSVLTGRTVGSNDNVVHVQVGWPGVSVALLHGMTPKVDLGGIFNFNYGIEGDVNADIEPGIKMQMLLRMLLVDSGRLNFGMWFAPGPLFYFRSGYRALIGFTTPIGFEFGIPVSPSANVNLGLDLPFWFYFNRGNGAVIPILMGGGVEYFVEHNLAVTFNLKMGPAIYTNSGVADFDLLALMGIAVKL